MAVLRLDDLSACQAAQARSAPCTRRSQARPQAAAQQGRQASTGQHRLSRERAALPRQAGRCRATSQAAAPDLEHNLEEAVLVPIVQEGVPEEEVVQFPSAQGVYAVYDAEGACQFVGVSRQIATSVARHYRELPEGRVHAVRFAALPDADRPALTAAWQGWLEQAVGAAGQVPPGNQKGNTDWLGRRPPKPELRLTPGKGLQDLTCTVEDLLAAVVKQNKVVAFIKGTRTQPQCGFSYKVLSILNESKADYEVVNVLDDEFNPTVREVIKTFSQWPTIPQLYVKGEFVGGADIVEELHTSGELKGILAA